MKPHSNHRITRRRSAGPGLVRGAIARHGGGLRGVYAVIVRSYKVVRALGWRGFVRRVNASRIRALAAVPIPASVAFPEPTPLNRMSIKTGVMVHMFYPDLLDEIASDLAHMPVPFVLMVSVTNEADRACAQSRLERVARVQALYIRVVANRGRDLAPLFVTFRAEILNLDVVCHLHTKKSLYAGSEQGAWRRYLIDALLGSSQRIAWILGMFQAMPALGIVYPESFASVPLWGHTWLGNAEIAHQLAPALGIDIDASRYFDYPTGSMFWARVDALRPLYQLGLKASSFPVERSQTDGTLQHALERLLGIVPGQQRMLTGILPADGSMQLSTQATRNWETYFTATLAQKIQYAAIDANVVSFDIFDTLVLRPFLTPSAAREYIAYLVDQQFGLKDFARLREQAEVQARLAAGHDADTKAIYQAMSSMPGMQQVPVGSIRKLELQIEQRLLRPRTGAVNAAGSLAQAHKRIVAVTDMYLNGSELQQVLPAAVAQWLPHIHVSCESGWRKDTGEAWEHLPAHEHVDPSHWLHIGDNEHADVQVPQAMGFIHPVHVLRPAALLDVVPALRSLRPAGGANWMDSLWLGLIANRLSAMADEQPGAFRDGLTIDDPETLGYIVFGPVLADYAIWLGQTAIEQDMRQILFLSREGYLLHRVYEHIHAAVPALQGVSSTYLLASRRGVGTPSVRSAEDLHYLLGSTFTGTLHDLLRARLGDNVATIVSGRLGKNAFAEVYVPAMKDEIVSRLRPAMDAILDASQAERDRYLQYWTSRVSPQPAMVADIGYAGTIQAHLMRLTNRALGGAYLATTDPVAQVSSHGGWAKALFHDARGNAGVPTPVLCHHLLLEAILTAHDGQFSHFEPTPGGSLKPIYVADERDARTRSLADSIQEGVEAFTRDLCAVVGPDVVQLRLDHALIQQPLDCLGTGRWCAGDWFEGFFVEDAYTGRGNVPVLGA